jgi:hypothetical protein
MMPSLARATLLATLLAPAASGLALAQATGDAVAPMLFDAKAAEVELIPQPFLPADQAELLKQVGVMQPYYGAIAISPDEGIMVEATVAAAGHHSTEAAAAAATSACDAKRKGATPCAVVALIRPKGWQATGFQLSSGANEAFGKDYTRIRRAKAFAISPSTGVWGIGKGKEAAAAAIEDCRTKLNPAPADCAVAIVD